MLDLRVWVERGRKNPLVTSGPKHELASLLHYFLPLVGCTVWLEKEGTIIKTRQTWSCGTICFYIVHNSNGLNCCVCKGSCP